MPVRLPKLLTRTEAVKALTAAGLKMTDDTLDRRVREGKIASYWLDGQRRFGEDDLADYVRRCRREARS